MIGLVLGETKFGSLIVKKLKSIGKDFIIIDISKRKIFKNNKNSFTLSIGQLGKAISLLKKNKCKKIIFAGKVKRPNFSQTKFDFKALRHLPRIIKASKKGDAKLMIEIIKIFTSAGFTIINSTFFNPELLLKKGNYTKVKPDVLSKRDINKGKNIIEDMSRHVIGQGVVIRKGYVISIEGPEGTDVMLKRAGFLIKRFFNKNKREGILLKFPKKQQDLRVDLPTVGIQTIKTCSKIGLKGIAVKANQNIFLDRSKCINLANKKKMFICAV